jgi:ferredoxin-type protein NapH
MVIESIPRSIGLLYGLVMVGTLAWLWYSGRWKEKIGWLLLGISTVLGFLIFAPVMPYQFEQLVLRNEPGLDGPLIAGVIGTTISVILVLLFGRFFCGYLCPVGAVQEIAYHAPIRKIPMHYKTSFMIFRAAFVLLFIALVFLLSTSLLSFFGIRDFFFLTLSTGAGVFLVIVIIATVFYRPFCRLFCPVGFLFSLFAWKSVFGLHRTDACINCKKCEKVCPVDEAGSSDRKAECYLCGRCVEICPMDAIRYGRGFIKDTSQKEN